jgi:hypothetical protein
MNKYIPFLLLLFLGPWLSAQLSLERQVVGSLGQSFFGTDLQLSATAGEAAVTTESAAGILLTQGFHQAEPEDLTSVQIVAETLTYLAAYPNPAGGQFWVEVTTPSAQHLNLEVLDGTGRRLSSVSQHLLAVTPTAIHFNSASWPAGIYLVRLLTDQGRLAGSVRMVVSGH